MIVCMCRTCDAFSLHFSRRDIKAAQVEETAAHEERIRQLKLREEEVRQGYFGTIM